MYSSTLSLTSALDVVVVQRHAPAALTPGKTRHLQYRKDKFHPRRGHEGTEGE